MNDNSLRNQKAVSIIQARMSSTRLPGKVLMDIEGRAMLWHVAERLRYSKLIKKIAVATSINSKDDPIEEFCRDNQLDCYRGSEEDVLDRYYQAAKVYRADPVVRVTGDCPLIDPRIIDAVIRCYTNNPELDFARAGDGYPEGFGVDVISFAALERAWNNARLKSEREHVSPYIWKNKPGTFKIYALEPSRPLPEIRLTVDREEDLEVAREVFKNIPADKKPFLLDDIVQLYQKKPWIFKLNRQVPRQEGYRKSVREDNS